MQLNISKKSNYGFSVSGKSSELDNQHSAANLGLEFGFWCSKKESHMNYEFIVLDLNEIKPFDYIELFASPYKSDNFPNSLRVEISDNSEEWSVIYVEKNIYLEDNSFKMNFPINYARYVKILIFETKKTGDFFFCELSKISVGIFGIKEISASKSSSPEKQLININDGKNDTYWESEIKEKPEKNEMEIDLSMVFPVSKVSLSTCNEKINAFPENFTIEFSTDQKIWITMVDERNFFSEKNTTYSWDFPINNVRFIKIEMSSVNISDKEFTNRISEINVFATVIERGQHHANEIVPYSSAFQAGIVRLAKDGEYSNDAALRADDRRLREASTLFKGIIQFAEDGEYSHAMALQSDDSRLLPATELKEGIVRLAYDGESKQGVVVQSSDSRLKEATETTAGIVKIAMDGTSSEFAVVRGNDSRLKNATVTNYGICRLARDGETNIGSVVQGNDKRLKDASSIAKGIVVLAEDGETSDGKVVQAHDKRLKNATTLSRGIVELAEDGEAAPFTVVQGNDKRLKDATTETKGIIELAENGEDAQFKVVQGNDKRLKDATENIKGIMIFAANNETSAMKAVQSNDHRLRDATTHYKGIVELANDGEDAPLKAVQGDDKRLKNATTSQKGIVQLADDGDNSQLRAVQGNDRRLKDATTQQKGIVEYAENGEDAPLKAVQGNDLRLKDATTVSKGIVELAENREDAPLKAVQGNDSRLKDATTVSKGIVELADDGEAAAGKAVQGNALRLKDATTVFKGIVELAENGEIKKGAVLQSDDTRIQPAGEDNFGIIRLSRNNETRKGFAVQSDDDRLSNKREPLPHDHNYAPLDHSFSSHSGTLVLKADKAQPFTGITIPVDDSSVIYSKNISDKNGSIAISGISNNQTEKDCKGYGVFGHSNFTGVRGQSVGSNGQQNKGCGVLGCSRFGAGGVFSSEHDYSLVVDGFGKAVDIIDDSIKMNGEGKAILVNGDSSFNGKIKFPKNNQNGISSITELFEVDGQEYISHGDILIISDQGNSVLARTQQPYNKAVIGIVAENSCVELDNCGKKDKSYPVVLSGRTLCKVDARSAPIKPGDYIVTSGTPGCGMKGTIDSFEKIGTVIGKALDSIEGCIGVIPVFICRM